MTQFECTHSKLLIAGCVTKTWPWSNSQSISDRDKVGAGEQWPGSAGSANVKETEKPTEELFYLMMHSKHFIYGLFALIRLNIC